VFSVMVRVVTSLFKNREFDKRVGSVHGAVEYF
jgi:hypothetical protein